MDDLWKIIVLIVKQMLHIKKPLFDEPENITITVADGVRITSFRWCKKVGDMTIE